MSQWRDDTRTRLRALRKALRQPGPERDALMLLVKAALATVLAWQFAMHVLHSPVPFYAPMAALLVVDRTMVRSVSASAQRIAAVILGLAVAWGGATLARRSPTKRFTYGLKGSTILAALTNALLLLVALGAIVMRALTQFFCASGPSPA